MANPIPGNLMFGQPTEYRGLGMAPIFTGKSASEFDYLTLDTAFDRSEIEIEETSEGGTVPELKLINRSLSPVLLLDGEELIGAKQNRVINLTVLVPAESELVIPVSCVESGRWNYVSRKFDRSERAHFARGRAKKMASVSRSMRDSGDRMSDQGEVWSEIDMKFDRMNLASDTAAMSDIYEDAASSIEDYEQELLAQPGQAGAFYFVHGRFAGVELFDRPATYAQLHSKLLKSYAIDAVEAPPINEVWATLSTALRFLEALARGQWEEYDAIGLGKDHRLLTASAASGALSVNGKVIQLSGFASDNSGSDYRPSHRRHRKI